MDKISVTYIGPSDGVEFVDPDGNLYVCGRGDAVQVPAALGASLLEQSDSWAPAKSTKQAKATTPEEVQP